MPETPREDTPRTYSISIRLQRTVTEYAYVAVPVTEAIMDVQPDGTGRVNTDRMWEEAVALCQQGSVRWFPETTDIQPHPIQKAPEPDERSA